MNASVHFTVPGDKVTLDVPEFGFIIYVSAPNLRCFVGDPTPGVFQMTLPEDVCESCEYSESELRKEG